MRYGAYLFSAWAFVISVIAAIASPAQAGNLFNNTNTSVVSFCPPPALPCQPMVTLSNFPTFTITQIETYHQQGAAPAGKTITLRARNSGGTWGPYQVTVVPAAPGFEDWIAILPQAAQPAHPPQIELPSDTYTVVDSEPDTWAQNSGSGNQGFTIVLGFGDSTLPSGSSGAAQATGSVTDCLAKCSLSASDLAAPNPPRCLLVRRTGRSRTALRGL
jgi:hypothetical protein